MSSTTEPVTPPVEQPAGAAEQTTVIARQAILDSKRAVFGYELYDRSTRSGTHSAESDAAMLFNVLSHAGTETLFGKKVLFINCTHEGLLGNHLELVHPDQVVLEIPPLAGNVQADIDAALPKLQELRKRGFRLAFNHTALTRAYAAWMPLAAFIKLDTSQLKPEVVEPFIRYAQKNTTAKLIAEKVETAQQYEMFARLGLQLFQGYWFAKPAVIQAKMISPAQANVIQLINLVRKEADPIEIEALLKRDPTLSFNLLRFINSSGFGLSVEVTSFRHAVMILGLKKLFRWAALLLTASRAGGSPPAVGNMAVLRGRLMELLAAEMLPADECDNAFVVGVFSLLDVMLGVSIDKALDSISLPEPVTEALLHRTGVFAPFLRVAEICETGTEEEVAAAAEALQLSNRQVNMAHLEALAWTENLLESGMS